ncbi:hypothetical protein C2S53_008995 [Perilla frutescens var. hirtella]|uniref:Retrotransposon gag domain-containing protein n=1 Tax=Perilla frutescens var. hirtella TaxID=608512 RepID=A0AAD4P0K4_PERFH|nr:hypothetical protein C2S53_008995 [Perilla frutescens var. hirtella]
MDRVESIEKGLEKLGAEFMELKTDFTTQLAAIQSVLSSIAAAQGVSSSAVPPSPPPNETPINSTNGLTGPGSLPRLDLPTFDGSDPRAWIARADQYFMVHQTPISDKVSLALVAMGGDVLFWVQWMMRRFPTISWSQFTAELLLRFDDGSVVNRFNDGSVVNPYEAMGITRQIAMVDDYVTTFVSRVAQLPNLPEAHYLGQFFSGLKLEIRDYIRTEPTMDIFTAVSWVRQVERELSLYTSTPMAKGSHCSPTIFPSLPQLVRSSSIKKSSTPAWNPSGQPTGQRQSTIATTAPRHRPSNF